MRDEEPKEETNRRFLRLAVRAAPRGKPSAPRGGEGRSSEKRRSRVRRGGEAGKTGTHEDVEKDREGGGEEPEQKTGGQDKS